MLLILVEPNLIFLLPIRDFGSGLRLRRGGWGLALAAPGTRWRGCRRRAGGAGQTAVENLSMRSKEPFWSIESLVLALRCSAARFTKNARSAALTIVRNRVFQ